MAGERDTPDFSPESITELLGALEEWVELEIADWDSLVEGTAGRTLPGGTDLWDHMPTIDSKAVARASPIFREFLGVPLDTRLIKKGGYEDAAEMGQDLIEKMRNKYASEDRSQHG